MFEVIRNEPLTPSQRKVLEDNTKLCITTGLASRYFETHKKLLAEFKEEVRKGFETTRQEFEAAPEEEIRAINPEIFDTEGLGGLLTWMDNDFKRRFGDTDANIEHALMAETYFAFALDGGGTDTCANLSVCKVDSSSGSQLPSSSLSVGFIGDLGNDGLSQDPSFGHTFTPEDLDLANERIKAQKTVDFVLTRFGIDKLTWVFE